MAVAEKQQSSDWVDRSQYPFESKYMNVDGGQMHYVDEGQGAPVVFIHGNPTWSYLYRSMIRDMSIKHRCIAMDHIGFGLSDKPEHWGYTPELHARNLAALIDRLNLTNITLVMHDYGGPIGMSYAIENPRQIGSLVVMNSWMWSLKENPAAKKAASAAANPLTKLITAPAAGMPGQFIDKFKFPDRLHEQYKKPFASASDRQGYFGLQKGLIGSSVWQHGLWARHEAIMDKPALILWGMQDRMFTPEFLARWRAILPNAKVETFAQCGHYVSEECANEVEAAIYLFIDGQREMSSHGGAIMGVGE